MLLLIQHLQAPHLVMLHNCYEDNNCTKIAYIILLHNFCIYSICYVQQLIAIHSYLRMYMHEHVHTHNTHTHITHTHTHNTHTHNTHTHNTHTHITHT